MLDSIEKLVDGTAGISVKITGLLMTVAFGVFLLAIISYIWKRKNGSADGLKQAGNMLFGSAFALFVMVAVWGITYFLSQNLGVAIGGCVPKPSSTPGVVSNDGCSTGTSGTSTASLRTNGSACSANSQCTSGYCGANICKVYNTLDINGF